MRKHTSNRRQLRLSVAGLLLVTLAGCSNGGGDSQRTDNTLPSIQLNDGDVLANGSSVVRIPATDDTGIASVTATLLRQGKLSVCASEIDLQMTADSLLEACLTDQPTCSVEFIPSPGEVGVYPPPLYAPIGLEYELTFIDRDGAATDPVNAVFCFDVDINTPPEPAADTYQLIFPSTIQRNGVSYDSRCEKLPGSDGVLANDDDDEHVTNTCLQAELVDPPRFATNANTFANTFRSDGGFRYEGLTNAPESDSFTYRVTDGVNPPSDPIRVDIIFSGENSPPIAVDDEFTIAEDSTAQTINVLSNDSDPDALPLSVSQINNGPTSGNASIRNGVVIEYQPNANFSGTDTFDYVVVDSAGVRATATVTIQVTPVNDPPVALNDNVTTDENTAVTINVIANDSDPEGDSLSVASVANPANGSAVIEADGRVRYTPDLNFSGVDAFEYTIEDGNGGSDTATARIVVNFVNVAPQLTNDAVTTSEGNAVDIDVLGNDVDNDDDELTITEVQQPSNGTATIVGNAIRYTPTDGFNGTDNFNYTVSDGTETVTAQVTVTVDAVNDPPVAENDSVSTDEDTNVVVAVLDNDTDPDGDNLSITITQAPTNGTATVVGSSISYTPDAGFSGSDDLEYTVTDPSGLTDSATVDISITNVNSAPQAADDAVSTPEDTAATIDVLNNDTDADGDTLTIDTVTTPANGSTAIQGSSVVYTPDNDFSGTNSFTYTISDADGETDTATVTVTVTDVNVAPSADNDTASTQEDTAVTIDVLENDSDPDGDTLSIDGAGSPGNGSTSVVGNSIVYTPDTGFSGTDSFSYTVSDPAGLIDTATVTVTVTNVNAAPVASNDTANTPEDTAVTIDVLGNDSDPDGDVLSIDNAGSPGNGSASVVNNNVVYTPDTGFSGSDTFTYTVTDPEGLTDTASVTVTITDVNAAPSATNDTASTPEDTAVTIDVLDNDSDPDGDTLSIDSAGSASNGTTSVENNSVLYTPATGFTGSDSFIYTVTDPAGLNDTATVTVTVNDVNGAPVAADDTASTPEDTAVNISVLTNDTDPDGDTLSVNVTGAPSNGGVSGNGNPLIYTPNSGFVGTDSFIYTITDPAGLSDTATVTVTVNDVNAAPIAADDTANTPESTTVTIFVLDNDSDPDGDTISIDSVGTPSNGTALVVGNDIEYTPDPGFDGSDSFTYTITESNPAALTATAEVSVSVTNVNNVPVAANDTGTTDEDTPVSISVLTNDGDADGDSLSVVISDNPSNGTAVVNGSNIDYTPSADFNGNDVIEYTVTDGSGGSDTASVSITVNAVNDAPVAIADTATTPQTTPIDIDVLANDSDVDTGDVLSVTGVTQPTSGTTSFTATQVSFAPNTGGTFIVEYTIADGNGGTAVAEVEVTVTAVNAPPVAVADIGSTDRNTAITIDVLTNDIDSDNDTLTLTSVGGTPTGTATISAGLISYTPDGTFLGADSFSYEINDGNGGTDTGSVTVNVANVSPVAVADAATTTVDMPVSIPVLLNDSDADTVDTLSIATVTTAPANGIAVIDGDDIVYTPDGGFTGSDTFIYEVTDGNGGNDTAEVTVSISA